MSTEKKDTNFICLMDRKAVKLFSAYKIVDSVERDNSVIFIGVKNLFN
jgi:hypothetical protein